MKKVMLVLLAILLSLSIACSEEMLRVSIIPEVEAYIDELSLAQGRKCSTDALQNCIRELESMGGKTASAMRLYCTVLVALDDGDFDTAKSAMSLLVLPNVAASFDESIVGSAGETSIATVEMLSYYLDGRAAESAGDDEAALEAYQQCAGEFDTLYRISAVKMRRFNKAVDLMLSGKYAEAEAILIALNAEGYEGASEYLQYCRNQMGRVEATATPRTAEVSAKMNALFTVGNYVTFGHYPQTKNGNDSTPIEWAVLARDGSKALLLSRYGLEAQPYNQVSANVTWEDCTLRAWLNDTFRNRAFTQEEQTAIMLTDVDNSRAQGYSSWATDGGSDTQDMVFLLSYADAQYYFGLVYGDKNNRMARTSPTPYALARGAWVSSDDPTYDGKYAAWWWLRSPGGEQNCAARVSPEGGLVGSSVSYTYTMIRPVIWVDLSSAVLQETAAAGTGTAVLLMNQSSAGVVPAAAQPTAAPKATATPKPATANTPQAPVRATATPTATPGATPPAPTTRPTNRPAHNPTPTPFLSLPDPDPTLSAGGGNSSTSSSGSNSSTSADNSDDWWSSGGGNSTLPSPDDWLNW